MKKSTLLLSGIFALASAVSNAAVITHEISSQANLYYTDWGHQYNKQKEQGFMGRPIAPESEMNALGTGVAATAINYNFADLFNLNLDSSEIKISVSGLVIDNGTTKTDANGCTAGSRPTCGHTFRGFAAYSVIGMWSTTADVITPISGSTPFSVGTGKTFDLSNLAALASSGSLYLFLANNDGKFSDNPNGAYTATITLPDALQVPTEVPVPAAAWLLGSALIGLSAVSRRRRIA